MKNITGVIISVPFRGHNLQDGKDQNSALKTHFFEIHTLSSSPVRSEVIPRTRKKTILSRHIGSRYIVRDSIY